MSRSIDFRTLVVQADPNHVRSSRRIAEYEFSAPARASALPPHPDADDTKEYNRSARMFYGDYQTRGAYASQPDVDGGLTWNGQQITLNGVPLTWGGG